MTTAVLEDRTTTIERAKSLTVKTASDRQLAADLWDAIRAFRKQEEANKEMACRPLKTAWDSAKVPYDRFVKECQGHETRLAGLMSAWDKEQKRIADAEQARLQAIVDRANAKIEAKAEAKGIEPVLKVAPVVQAPPKSIETQAGTVSTRSEKKVYGILNAADKEDLKANDPRIASLLTSFPSLFVFDWVAFRMVASTGMLDSNGQVVSRIDYIYTQRSGR